ncbi:MAG: glycolate oxidase subunit GlcE [Alphaproteobacteria bacterium]
MTDTFKPENADQVVEAVAWAAAEARPLEVAGRGTKRGFGRPVRAAHGIELSGLTGITLYEPVELVLSARAGTPLAEIEAALAGERQQLAFEPGDLGPLLGTRAGAGSIGGMLACNLAGPRRIKAGAARDHFLGASAVSGRGEAFKFGGRVVKNVTGYDLCKLLAGSYGTLAVLTDVTVKVMPAPEKTRTVLLLGLDDAGASAAMTRALQSSHEVSGAAHLPAAIAARSAVSYVAQAGGAVTALRVEGPGPSVDYRCAALRKNLADLAESEELHSMNSVKLWAELRDVAPFVSRPERPVWRVSVPPDDGSRVVAAVAHELDAEYFYDWGGGLIWLAPALPGEDAGAARIRAVLGADAGHATLLRAPAEVRAAVPVFQPQEPAKAALTTRIKDGFDPKRVLNPGRMYAGV